MTDRDDTADRVRDLAQDVGSYTDGFTGLYARLRGLKLVYDAAHALAEQTAHELGHKGATYGDLGNAWGITRQGARRRWPTAVPVREKPAPCEHCNGTGRTC